MTHDHYKGRKSLADMIRGHLAPLRKALEAERDSKRDVLGHDEAAYWDHEIAALDDIAAAVTLDYHPRDMITAPMDGTRILVQTEVQHYVALYDRPNSLKAWKPVGTQWVEARYHSGRWQEWCGTDATNSTCTLKPLQWRPLP